MVVAMEATAVTEATEVEVNEMATAAAAAAAMEEGELPCRTPERVSLSSHSLVWHAEVQYFPKALHRIW